MNELQDFLSPTSARCIPGICNGKSCNFLQQQVKPMQGNSLTNQILFPRPWIILRTARRQNQTPFVILLFRRTSSWAPWRRGFDGAAGEFCALLRRGGEQLYKVMWTGVTFVYLSYFSLSGRNCSYLRFFIFCLDVLFICNSIAVEELFLFAFLYFLFSCFYLFIFQLQWRNCSYLHFFIFYLVVLFVYKLIRSLHYLRVCLFTFICLFIFIIYLCTHFRPQFISSKIALCFG